MKTEWLLGLLLIIISSSESARILGIIPSTSYSHQIVFHPLWRELSLHGHQVTTLTTDPMKDPKLINLTEIDLHSAYDVWNSILLDAIESSHTNVFKAFNIMLMAMDKISEIELGHPDVQKLIHDKNAKFDLLMVEFFTPAMLAFAERFNCPIIALSSMNVPSTNLKLIGNPTFPGVYSDMMFFVSDQFNIIDRIINVAGSLMSEIYLNHYFYWVQQKQVEKFFGSNYSCLKEIAQNVSLLFINTDTVFYQVKPFLPNVIQIGGGLHRHAPKPLPKELEEILDNAYNGVIYFSLGSNAKSKDIPVDTRNAILSVFDELPYTVLWKFETDDILNKPKNVFISKWYPQQDILKHPNIILFITQGGLQSIEEAIYEHIPMIGIPYFADQFMNVQTIVKKGIGLSLEHTKLDKETFKSTILEVINNPKYKNQVKQLGELAVDQPMTGLEKAVWWTEYVIRHKGAKHLRSPLLDIPSYQYYLLDVIGILLVCAAVVTYILYILLKLSFLLIKYICCSKQDSKLKAN